MFIRLATAQRRWNFYSLKKNILRWLNLATVESLDIRFKNKRTKFEQKIIIFGYFIWSVEPVPIFDHFSNFCNFVTTIILLFLLQPSSSLPLWQKSLASTFATVWIAILIFWTNKIFWVIFFVLDSLWDQRWTSKMSFFYSKHPPKFKVV